MVFFVEAWPKIVQDMTSIWRDFNYYWLHEFRGDLLVVQYEHLKKDLPFQIKRMLTFLNVSISEERLQCALKLSEGLYHRAHSDNEKQMDVFTDAMISYMNKAIQSLQ